ncbi:MAG: SUMF1/EgtB/PvdO family nonheme iron enzyme [Candidatus Micrarchaeota archaeon]
MHRPLLFAALAIAILLFGCSQPPAAPTPSLNASSMPSTAAAPTQTAIPSPSKTPLIDVPDLTPSPIILSPTPIPDPITFVGMPMLNLTNLTSAISWNTKQKSSSIIEWGKTNRYGSIDKKDDNSTYHSFNISGLRFLTEYHYRVISCIGESCNRSDDFMFTTGHKQCLGGSSYIENGDFCIDGFEAYVLNGKAISQGGRVPTSFISREDAQSACEMAGKRLCTSEEFTAACNIRGQSYGKIGANIACNIGNTSYVPAGHASNCTSDKGVHDLIGNFWEWVSDTVTEQTPFYEGLVDSDNPLLAGKDYAFPRQSNAQTEVHGNDYYYNWEANRFAFIGEGMVRGGYYGSHEGGGCFAFAVGVPFKGDIKVGFRCCS